MVKNANRTFFQIFALSICTTLMVSCDGAGVQGTSLYSLFQGLSSVQAVSPTSVELNWGLDSQFTEYRVYQNDDVAPIKRETFGTTQIKNLLAGTVYYYQISGYSSDGEKFIGGKSAVTTFSHFNGLPAGGVVGKSISEVKLSWTMNSPTTVFKVYHKPQAGTWNLNAPAAVITDGNSYSVTGLSAGQTYCFYVRAEYKDGTFEPSATTESGINSLAKCLLMTAPMASLPSVNINSITFGDFPWFWTSSGDSTYRTDIYDLSNDTLVASRTGNGYFRSTVILPQSNKSFYALVSNPAGNVSRVDVNVNSINAATSTAIRKINSTGQKGPIFPPILSNGLGTQNLGAKIAQGDFNCDGLPDFAVSSPQAVPFTTPDHFTGIGAVTVYYTYRFIETDANGDDVEKYKIKTDVTPSSTAVAPNPQLISYSVSGSNAQLGQQIAVGNFNGDCYQRNPSLTGAAFVANGSPRRGSCDQIYTSFTTSTDQLIRDTKKCDDLAIGSRAGYFYVVYGDPNLGLVTGSMSNSAGADEQTCDATSSTCRASQYFVPPGYGLTNFGRAMAAGDFNNDGFDDIAISSNFSATNVDDILIYSGDSLGTVPYGNATKSFASIRPNNTVGLTYVSPNNLTDNSPDPGHEFGFSLTAVPNSRVCKNGIPAANNIYRTRFNNSSGNVSLHQSRKGIDATKCADLVIGAPNRPHTIGAVSTTGSIYTCRSSQPINSQVVNGWSCLEHWPDVVGNEVVSGYGHSVLGVANQNGYPLGPNVGVSGSTPLIGNTTNVWGALFVGAPGSTVQGLSNVGSVYGYYITETTGTDNTAPGISKAVTPLGPPPHVINKDNDVPCDRANSDCGIQRLFVSPGQSWMRFGETLSSINVGAGAGLIDPGMPILAVGAPYRDNVNGLGVLTPDSGALYLFRGDISTFMNQTDGPDPIPANNIQIASPYYNPGDLNLRPCNLGVRCTWLSGGVSPYGATIVYNSSLPAYSHFGLGGAVGVTHLATHSFNGDSDTDFIATAPNNSFPTNANGGVYAYYSTAGSFSSTVTSANLPITENLSLEGNYKFEEAQIVGDLNGDGYQDVMAHINNNNNWVLVVYYGSVNGLIQTPTPSYTASGTQPKLIRSSIDTGMGEQFYKAGDMNGDGYADIVVLSSKGLGSYIYYGSTAGLVTGVEPSISPIGKNPLRFGIPGGTNTVSFNPSTSVAYNAVGIGDIPEYNHRVQSIVYGKFNNDVYDDIAIRVAGIQTLPSLSPAGVGRVFIIYGTALGPKLDNITGRIILDNGLGQAVHVVAKDPCSTTNYSDCKVQMIASPAADTGEAFGFAMARRSLYIALTQQDGLLISDPRLNAGNGVVYVYRGTDRGLDPDPIQKLVPRDINTKFGYSIVEAGDINGDRINDVAISAYSPAAASPRAQTVAIFYGRNRAGTSVAGVGLSNLSAYGGALEGNLQGTNYWNQAVTPVTISDNRMSSNTDLAFDYRPQMINPITSMNTDYFGYGMTAVGDINQDGFNDLAVNIPNGDYRLSGTVTKTGYVMIFFGSDMGLQIDPVKTNPTPYPRCYKGSSPLCDPYHIYIPQFEQNDFTHINANSAGDINGDGIIDLIFGVSGRSHPSGKGISTGVIYVLY